MSINHYHPIIHFFGSLFQLSKHCLAVDSFGRDSLKPITKDDDVICTTEYSKIVPLEDGEIPVMLLNNRPSANNYFNSTVLQEWTRATNVRFRFYRTKNLLGHLMSVARQDPTVTRRVSDPYDMICVDFFLKWTFNGLICWFVVFLFD